MRIFRPSDQIAVLRILTLLWDVLNARIRRLAFRVNILINRESITGSIGAIMSDRPKSVVLASSTALVGALFVVAVAISGLDIEADGFVSKMGFCALLLVFFLAISGSLYMNGQWSWRFLIFAEALCTAVPILAYLVDALELVFCAAILILSCLTLVFTTTREAKRWVESDRI
jgi:hypothetical protein